MGSLSQARASMPPSPKPYGPQRQRSPASESIVNQKIGLAVLDLDGPAGVGLRPARSVSRVGSKLFKITGACQRYLYIVNTVVSIQYKNTGWIGFETVRLLPLRAVRLEGCGSLSRMRSLQLF